MWTAPKFIQFFNLLLLSIQKMKASSLVYYTLKAKVLLTVAVLSCLPGNIKWLFWQSILNLSINNFQVGLNSMSNVSIQLNPFCRFFEIDFFFSIESPFAGLPTDSRRERKRDDRVPVLSGPSTLQSGASVRKAGQRRADQEISLVYWQDIPQTDACGLYNHCYEI